MFFDDVDVIIKKHIPQNGLLGMNDKIFKDVVLEIINTRRDCVEKINQLK